MDTATERMPFFTLRTVILLFLALVGAAVAIFRLIKGLGATTNLSDMVPWGLWIWADLSLVALGGCGFTFAAVAYIFNLKRYHLILRRAILMGLLCYVSFSAIIFFEVGRPFRIWHTMIMWQHHSVLFEVTWCVMLYTTVLVLEFSPVVFEKFKMDVPLRFIRTITIPLVMAGIILSTLHQSSLGSLYLIVPNKLHIIWWTPILPLLFFISAIMAGLAMVIFESFISFRVFKRTLEMDIISGLAKAEVFVLLGYLILKIIDVVIRGALPSVFTGSMEGNMFILEIIIGVLLPIILLSLSQSRKNTNGIFLSSIMIITGVVFDRMNVSIIGLLRESKTVYFPAWTEFAITIGIIAGGLLAFRFAVKFFDVFHSEGKVIA